MVILNKYTLCMIIIVILSVIETAKNYSLKKGSWVWVSSHVSCSNISSKLSLFNVPFSAQMLSLCCFNEILSELVHFMLKWTSNRGMERS